MNARQPRWSVLLTSAVVAGLALVGDLMVEGGVGVAVAYVLVVALIQVAGRKSWVWVGAAACSGLALLGFVLSADAAPVNLATANLLLAVAAIWVVAVLGVRRIDSSAARDAVSARLQVALDADIIGTWSWDRRSGRTWMDQGLARLFAADPRPIATDGLAPELALAAVHPEDRPEVERSVQDSLAHGGTLAVECRLVASDGCETWVSARGHVERDAGGRAIIVSGIALDATELKRAEELVLHHADAAADASAKFQVLFDQASLFTLVLTPDGVVAEANQASLDACGYDAQDVVGEPVWDTAWWRGSDEVRDTIRLAVGRAADGEPFREDVPLWWADGTQRVHELGLHPVHDRRGRVTFLQLTGADVTERRAAAERQHRHAKTFTRLVDDWPFGIYVVDSRLRIARVSVGALPAFRNVDPLIGRDLEEALGILWPAPFRDEAVAAFRRTLETGERYRAPSLTEKRADIDATESYEWELHRVTLPDDNYGVVCHFFNTTALRKVETALRASEQRAHRSSRAKSEFLANMSHEIRTPMTAILGHVDILMASLQDEDNRECVATIKRNGTHLLAIINDILDLSRIEAGKLGIEFHECSLPGLLTDVESLMRVRVDGGSVEFKITAHTRLPSTVRTDENRLRQVLINLVGNAIKFTEFGHVEIGVSLAEVEAQPHVRFDVADTGIGIAAEDIESILEPFAQADTSEARSFGGTGLGLAICKRLVDLLGGTLEVESEVGRGSVFSVSIPTGPLAGVPLVDLAAESVAREECTPETVVALDCSILLVDDHPDVRSAAQRFLEEAGAAVVTAEDGLRGVQEAEEASVNGRQFDVVLMDMQMPRVDGYTAVSELRSRGFDRPIVALTAAAMPGDRERCLDAGCDEYLSKPLDRSKLVALVHNITTNVQGLREKRRARKARQFVRRDDQESDARDLDVLVVDDNVDAAAATATLLRMEGFETSVAHDGAQALAAAIRDKPSVVLLDIGLPDMSGRDVARELRDGGYAGVVVALSGRSGSSEEKLSLAAGCDAHLAKPVAAAEIMKTIHECRRRRAVR